jgi:hypothetical protein
MAEIERPRIEHDVDFRRRRRFHDLDPVEHLR